MLSNKAFKILIVLGAALAMLSSSVDAAPASAVEAAKGESCIRCFAPPMCPPCAADETCVIVPADCHSCGSGTCTKKAPTKRASSSRCIQCFAPPTCPPCKAGTKCVIVPATCDDCGRGYCA
ncbi:hypothetical protein KVV02_006710 [Mortierella alpina]|uniref:Membrane anchor Opy2 N-terminal domain-containing protein n=1 Tax=Mortierella alpina TaxID=64518 RepID=A0A9P8A4R1_MORAP|nr:hypothetical protein KVV02_006710 [Mortierella alpina]